MAPAQAQAQAQAQQQHTISHTESLELVRCLLRVSVFHISYLRGLFPDNYFKGVDMKNLDGMNIKILMPHSEESRRLIDWVEEGVYDAIRMGYLKTLFFGVATDPGGSNLLEEYIFNFAYGNGKVTMDVQQKTKAGTKGALNTASAHKADMDIVKYQVTRLMRMLVQICQTLDKVPQERYLFMKLMYHDNTPENYDPPYFVSLPENQGIGHFSRKPFSMTVGEVGTKHHNVSMKIKSTLDCCEEEEDDAEVDEPEVVASAQQQPSTAMEEDDGASKARVHQESDVTMPDPNLQELGSNAGVPGALSEEQYRSVKNYVLGCFQSFSQVELVDAMGFFLDVHPNHIHAAFVRMQQEGIVVADALSHDTFRPVLSKPATTEAEAAQMMANLGMGESASQRGEIKATGSEVTGNGSALPDCGQNNHQGSQPTKPVYFDAGLQSGAQQGTARKTRARKASFVEEPIYQAKRSGGAKRVKRAAAEAAPTPVAMTTKGGRGRK